MNTVLCYCGAPARYADNAEYYGRSYGNGKCWMCSRFPDCDGYVGTHPDGQPLGFLVDKETRRWRLQVHAQIDPLWQDPEVWINRPQLSKNKAKRTARTQVYGWLRHLMKMSPYDCHVGMFTTEQCIEALEQIALHPYEERTA
jgi:hypothetical protein